MGSIVNSRRLCTPRCGRRFPRHTDRIDHVNLKVYNAKVVLSTGQIKGRMAWCFMMKKYPNASCQFVKSMRAARQKWPPAEFYSQTVFGANIWFDLHLLWSSF